jgi:tRNA pseudouridine38-40 synthase
MRFLFEIAYNGTNYNGWQTQQQGTSIQSVVEDAMSKMLRDKIEIVGSGRTDAGVHCEQQFFHVDINREFEAESFLQRLNSFLPRDITIPSVRPIQAEAHARYDAIERAYHYDITRVKNPFLIGLAWHYFKAVDVSLMNETAAFMIGEQDFECFSKVKTNVKHFLCDVKKASWTADGNKLEFTIVANRFLRGMVRAVVGTLLDVGTGKISPEDFQKIIKSRDRKKAGANVPPYGLYLASVKYPPEIFIS